MSAVWFIYIMYLFHPTTFQSTSEIAKKAHKEGTSLKEAAIATGYLTAEEFDQWIVPADMIGPSPPTAK